MAGRRWSTSSAVAVADSEANTSPRKIEEGMDSEYTCVALMEINSNLAVVYIFNSN